MNRVPGYNTVQQHVRDVPERYLTKLVRLTANRVMNAQGRSACDAASDGTGIGTREYQREVVRRQDGRQVGEEEVRQAARPDHDGHGDDAVLPPCQRP